MILDESNHCGTEKDGEPKIMFCYYDVDKEEHDSKCDSPSDIQDKYSDPNDKILIHCGCCIVPDEISEKDQDKNCPSTEDGNEERRIRRRLHGVTPRGA